MSENKIPVPGDGAISACEGGFAPEAAVACAVSTAASPVSNAADLVSNATDPVSNAADGLPALLWACPAAAGHYDPGALSAADTLRAGARRTPRAALQWRVSRAALQQAGVGTGPGAPGSPHPAVDADSRSVGAEHAAGLAAAHAAGLIAVHAAGQATALAWSLSHSDGHALVAYGPAGWRMGVDLERKRERDLEGLAQWCCDAAEQAHLRALPEADQLTFFYQLWTLKESFIKAAGLDFPADMRKVGLRVVGDGWALRAPTGAWAARCWTIGEDWVASVVWSVPEGAQVKPAGLGDRLPWRAAKSCVLPPIRSLYAASST